MKNGGLNFVLGGERDGTHWFGGDVIKEVGSAGFFQKRSDLSFEKAANQTNAVLFA